MRDSSYETRISSNNHGDDSRDNARHFVSANVRADAVSKAALQYAGPLLVQPRHVAPPGLRMGNYTGKVLSGFGCIGEDASQTCMLTGTSGNLGAINRKGSTCLA